MKRKSSLFRHSVWRAPSTLKGMTQGCFFQVLQPKLSFARKGRNRSRNMIIQTPGNVSCVNEFYVGVKNCLGTFQDPN